MMNLKLELYYYNFFIDLNNNLEAVAISQSTLITV